LAGVCGRRARGRSGLARTPRTLQAGDANVHFDPPLTYAHRLVLHQTERGSVALLGTARAISFSASCNHVHSRSISG
jgi:hypothetical protein